ncbi:hypothetical protein EMMF5_002112 [Cystobasidiomycetes sp. EMM_F5]
MSMSENDIGSSASAPEPPERSEAQPEDSNQSLPVTSSIMSGIGQVETVTDDAGCLEMVSSRHESAASRHNVMTTNYYQQNGDTRHLHKHNDAPDSEATPARKVNKPGKHFVGGLLASSSAMKPFRSPLSSTARPSARVTISHDAIFDSPLKTTLPKNSTPLRNSAKSALSSSIIGRTTLAKPFKSPIVKRALDSESPSQPDSAVTVGEQPSMTSLQLSSALPSAERRLAILRNAKRHLAAKERGTPSSDNTDHIRELSRKWLVAGREAADMLWNYAKDSNQGDIFNDTLSRSKQSNGFDKSWGWAGPDIATETMRDRVTEELQSMTDSERAELYRCVEDDDERHPLPDAVDLINRPSKRARREQTDNDAHERTFVKAREYDQYEPYDESTKDYVSSEEGERDDDGKNEEQGGGASQENSGMRRMLMQCGIDCAMFGWDEQQEEWRDID